MKDQVKVTNLFLILESTWIQISQTVTLPVINTLFLYATIPFNIAGILSVFRKNSSAIEARKCNEESLPNFASNVNLI